MSLFICEVAPLVKKYHLIYNLNIKIYEFTYKAY